MARDEKEGPVISMVSKDDRISIQQKDDEIEIAFFHYHEHTAKIPAGTIDIVTALKEISDEPKFIEGIYKYYSELIKEYTKHLNKIHPTKYKNRSSPVIIEYKSGKETRYDIAKVTKGFNMIRVDLIHSDKHFITGTLRTNIWAIYC